MNTPITSQIIDHSEHRRTDATAPTRHELGQFITPKHVADFMASLFSIDESEIQLLDAGAGAGALTSAFVGRLVNEARKPKRIQVTAYEIDDRIIGRLRQTMAQCQVACETVGIEFVQDLRKEDFLDAAAASLRGDLFSAKLPNFNVAIVNPPYRKLRSDSAARLILRSAGIETSNFYTAFVALIIKLLAKKGEVVAITPRSFCNGPYFKPFRDLLLDSMSLRRLHLFDSRSAAFGKDNVLQENLIFHAVKGEKQKDHVIVSNSSGHVSAKVTESAVPYSEVIAPNDPERFIHVDVGANGDRPATFMNGFKATLADLDISVSTGRVVDFRSRDFLRKLPGQDTAPLIYPCHFESGVVAWPKNDSKKPNAIVIHEKTIDLLVPRGVYVLVKRFSSKEERRRIVACIYDPAKVPARRVAFENHLNYFHISGHGLSMTLAKGLAVFLNSTFVDSYFRRFSGHTQVNAADLRKLNYPTRSELERLGTKSEFAMTQKELDQLLEMELS